MAAVVFSIGAERPGLSEHEARELVELLERRRTLASQSAARKIREQADKDPGHETSQDVDLDRDQLGELAAVLDEPRAPEELPAFAHLRAEVLRALESPDLA
ncbi:hypothetical protein AYO48_03640 [Gaiella sp. SCGC AG-212-M14]|nr:hypothetical protein AYO48_03640 [Gaiella sp. SCGC AG-212-M14]